MREPIVRLENVIKEYASRWWPPRRYRVLDGLTVEVHEGEIFGLLGPNGAGKTTTIALLVGVMRPTKGTVRLFGRSPEDPSVRAQLGFLPEHPFFPDLMTARELLDSFARLWGMSRAERQRRIATLLDLVGVTEDLARRRLRDLSRGELTRVGMAQALLHDPKLLVLDDPMAGLDPEGRRQWRDLFLRVRAEGKTIFFTTHLVVEAETLCDRVALLHRGRLLACGPPEALASSAEGGLVEILVQDLDPQARESLLGCGFQWQAEGSRVRVRGPAGSALWEGLDIIRRHRGRLLALTPLRSPLEQFFDRASSGSDQLVERPHVSER